MHAIRVHKTGGPEALAYESVDSLAPAANEALVRIEAAGLNYIDIYHRTGLYDMPLPFTPGLEAAGVVEAVGSDVDAVKVGDRVAYTMQIGSYAEYNCVPVNGLAHVPDALSTETAAALMLQGMTAHYLAFDTYKLEPGTIALVHAAAGGVGLLLTQIAKMCGAFVIATVSTEEKEQLARQAGADEVIRYTEMDFEAETKRITGAEGVHVVYDAVGQATFDKSLNCLRPRGLLALYGQASGPVPPFDLGRLGRGGSLFVTRPSLGAYIATRDEMMARADDLFQWVASGELNVRVDRTFPLAQAGDAHRYMEARKTKGKVLLIP